MSYNIKDKLKMICNNPSCLNKATVYRRFDIMREQTCAACKQPLTLVKSIGQGRRVINKERIENELKGLQ